MSSPTLADVFQDAELARRAQEQPFQFKFPVAPNIRIVGEHYPPHIYITEYENGTDSFDGALINMLKMMATSLNFTYTLYRPPDGGWGYMKEDGSFTGMIGMIHRDEVDMGLGPFITTYERSIAATFTPPLVVDTMSVLAGRQSPKVDPYGFLKALGPLNWLGFGVSWVIVAFVLLVADRIYRGNKEVGVVTRTFDLIYALGKVILQQEVKISMSFFASSRLLVGLWLLFCMVLIRSYTGALVSMLAVRNVPILFKDLQDISQHETIKVIVEKGSTVPFIIKNGESGPLAELAKFYDDDRIIEEGLGKFYSLVESNVVNEMDMLLITEKIMLASFMQRNFKKESTCTMYLLSEYYLSFAMAMPTAKNSPMNNLLTSRLLRYQSMGLYDHWLKTSVIDAQRCYNPPTKVSFTEPYGIISLWAVFLFLAIGLLLATLVFILEVLIKDVEALKPVKWREFDDKPKKI